MIYLLGDVKRTVFAEIVGRSWRASSDKAWGALGMETLMKVLNWMVLSYCSLDEA